MASVVAETTVSYQGSPIAVDGRRHGKVPAGDHLPHVSDAALQKQLRAACGSGHTVITIAAGHVAPAAGGVGPTQVLATGADTAVAGYDSVVADPDGLLARRLGLSGGGRIVVRPDGYLGAVAVLEDPRPIVDYFTRIGA